MPRKVANPQKRSTKKQKPTAREHATARIAERPKSDPKPRVPASVKKISQERFPGETPLTGEDRPQQSRGAKKQQGKTEGVFEARPSAVSPGGPGRKRQRTQ